MLKPSLALLALAACAADTADPIEVTLESDDKADGLSGKRIYIEYEGVNLLDAPGTTQDALAVRFAAGDKLIVRATYQHIEGSIDWTTADGRTYWDLIHRVTFVSKTQVQIGGVLVHDRHILTCQTPRGRSNYFRSIAVDFFHQQITLNGTTTVSLAACGLPVDVPGGNATKSLTIVPMPIAWSSLGETTYDVGIHYEQL
jgi:hypothetical protein